jgi:hypothetical protein
MPHASSNPIHEVGITRIGKNSSILPGRRTIATKLPLLLFHPQSLLFLPPLSLRPIIQQKRQRAAKRQNNERFKDIRINVIAIFVVNDSIIVVGFIVVPAREFGFQKSGEPFGQGLVFLSDFSNQISASRECVVVRLTRLVLDRFDLAVRNRVPPTS